jgi:hypothetical protein
MKNATIKLFLVCLTAAITFSACSKKEGCSNEVAINYDSGVKEKNDDGSCTYQGQSTIWIEEGFVDYYIDKFPIKITADGEVLGTLTASDFLESAPACNADKAATFTVDLGASRSKGLELNILSDSDEDFYIYKITVTAGECGVGRL